MDQTGGCLCGAVRYRVTGAPQATSLCHCFSCRRSTGAPSLAWAIFAEDAVEITDGALAEHESSPNVYRGFCARCGTSLTYRRDSRPGCSTSQPPRSTIPRRFRRPRKSISRRNCAG